MAKQGMKRPERTHTQPRNEVPPVPEIQGKAKNGKERARPIIAGTKSPEQKVFHAAPVASHQRKEKPISNAYPAIDNDLARDNIEAEYDVSAADSQDL